VNDSQIRVDDFGNFPKNVDKLQDMLTTLFNEVAIEVHFKVANSNIILLGVKEYTSTIQLVNFWDFDMDRSSLVGL
jgi:hypothetical protein